MMQFADRAYHHLFNEGALTDANSIRAGIRSTATSKMPWSLSRLAGAMLLRRWVTPREHAMSIGKTKLT